MDESYMNGVRRGGDPVATDEAVLSASKSLKDYLSIKSGS